MYIARQPILDRKRSIAGYELLFRGDGPVTDGVLATSHVAASAFTDPEFADVLGPHRGFINVDAQFLMSDRVEFLPPQRTVVEILEDTRYTPEVVARCRELKARGYLLAADDYAGNREVIAPALGLLDIVKVDLPQVNGDALAQIARELGGKTLLAEKVETREDFERCLEAGYALFQGYFFAKPAPAGAIRTDPGRLAAVGLLAMLAREASDAALENEFKRHGTLVVGLLRLVNSAAAGLSRRIDSIRQALLVVGRKQLQLWLQLLVYLGASGGDPAANPLVQLAAVRAKTMELAAVRLGETGQREFIAGLVSLFDVALGMSREEIARRIGLDEEMREGLVRYAGQIGALLRLAEAIERDVAQALEHALEALPAIATADLEGISTAAHRWAGSLGDKRG